MRRIYTVIAIALLNGCAAKHHDVLLFGTDTSFGVNVGADPAAATVTNVAIGYRRREAVFMPLLANGVDSKAPLTGDAKYQGSAEGSVPCDKGCGGTDTYSVFASFGGRASGKTGAAGLQVAQFFATGIAAQRLAKNERASELVATGAPQATAEAAAAEASVAQSMLIRSEDLAPELKIVVAQALIKQSQNAEAVKAHLVNADGSININRRDCLLQNASPPEVTQVGAADTADKLVNLLKSTHYIDLSSDLKARIADCQ